jgi:small-conductance mechanosensitive channel
MVCTATGRQEFRQLLVAAAALLMAAMWRSTLPRKLCTRCKPHKQLHFSGDAAQHKHAIVQFHEVATAHSLLVDFFGGKNSLSGGLGDLASHVMFVCAFCTSRAHRLLSALFRRWPRYACIRQVMTSFFKQCTMQVMCYVQ